MHIMIYYTILYTLYEMIYKYKNIYNTYNDLLYNITAVVCYLLIISWMMATERNVFQGKELFISALFVLLKY